ncbi:flavin-containing monooxygenase [Streptomyces sp. NPDC049541]|uniref:flavin-containing monooxygenase n=1 Tax=Streptomyces sp. NPDC049541 TaxID=3365594 RepID=UPI0037ACB9F8
MVGAAMAEVPHAVEVAIVGGGLSGLAAAITLRSAGFKDIVVLEKSGRPGGTWRDNTYPGCSCDVPSLLYEYSFAPGPWTRSVASQPEILGYLQATAAEHHLDDVIRFGIEVQGGRWDPSGHWHLRTSAGDISARAVIMATGPWNRPRYPDLPGLTAFPGAVFHSARWDHGVDLTGLRVCVIGNSASTVQFLPELQRRAAQVDIFQSTAPWVLPKPDYALPRSLRHLLQRQPAVRRFVRALHARLQDTIGLALRHPQLLPPLETAARLHLRRAIPDPGLRQALTPDHRLGARRLLISATYYPALLCPNVRLNPTRAVVVDNRTIVGADGRRLDADAVILATGFHVGDLPLAPRLYGTDNQSLAQTWSDGRHAYLGTSVSGYPNLFLLLGPNILNGTTAVPTVLEAQLRYITDALNRLRHGNTALDVRPDVERAHNLAVQKALKSTVYATDESSYYFSTPGLNTFCWPWSTRRLLRQLHTFDPDAYNWSAGLLPAQGSGAATGRPHPRPAVRTGLPSQGSGLTPGSRRTAER